jgi:hypothetical protein
MGFTALTLATSADAAIVDGHLAVDCPQPYSQTCTPRQGLSVKTTSGFLFVGFTADGNPPQCASGLWRLILDGHQWDSPVRVDPGQNAGSYFLRTNPGIHQVDVQMDGTLGGCNTGAMSGWSGTLHVETDDAALSHGVEGPSFRPS